MLDRPIDDFISSQTIGYVQKQDIAKIWKQ